MYLKKRTVLPYHVWYCSTQERNSFSNRFWKRFICQFDFEKWTHSCNYYVVTPNHLSRISFMRGQRMSAAGMSTTKLNTADAKSCRTFIYVMDWCSRYYTSMTLENVRKPFKNAGKSSKCLTDLAVVPLVMAILTSTFGLSPANNSQ